MEWYHQVSLLSIFPQFPVQEEWYIVREPSASPMVHTLHPPGGSVERHVSTPAICDHLRNPRDHQYARGGCAQLCLGASAQQNLLSTNNSESCWFINPQVQLFAVSIPWKRLLHPWPCVDQKDGPGKKRHPWSKNVVRQKSMTKKCPGGQKDTKYNYQNVLLLLLLSRQVTFCVTMKIMFTHYAITPRQETDLWLALTHPSCSS